jgi:hypothetical protein
MRSSVSLMLLIGAWAWGLTCAESAFQLRVISSQPNMVTGADVLVRLRAPNWDAWVAELNGRDVTLSFRPSDGDSKLALLRGLHEGNNSLAIRVHGTTVAELEIFDHSLAGPVFSGPRQEPFVCQTAENGLGPPLDADCDGNTVVQYYYKSREPPQPFGRDSMMGLLSLDPGALAEGFKPYNPSDPLPPDVAQTTTYDGHLVNYIVRREIGVINRAVYDIQFLHQPGQPLPSPWNRSIPGWNGRLAYLFGGGCGAGYHQGTLHIVGRTQEPLIAQGYAVATSTLNIFENNCNATVSAETLAMVKEHFIKTYGEPVHTIGWGASGGSMELYLIAQNYPGLLDGIVPFISFPDMTSTAQSVTDCELLDRAFTLSKGHWTEEQKAAVSGFATWRTCNSWSDGRGRPWEILDPQTSCPSLLPKQLIYDRAANPQGVRCDIFTNEINAWERNLRTGLAQRPIDNVGVQYGLAAFNSGKISGEQFLSLNEVIGGYDADGHIVAARSQADPEALRIAYQRGLILTGGGGLGLTPIIDWHPYADDLADQHDLFRSFVVRARLIAANGNADNQVVLVDAREGWMAWLNSLNDWDTRFVSREGELVADMDRWLDAIAMDKTASPLPAKVAHNKPRDLADGCWATSGERIVERATYGARDSCNQLYPPHADPRIAAGAPLADDVLKCVLKPVDPSEYSGQLSDQQLERLKGVFPFGVCDYSQPGVGQGVTKTVWQQYGSPVEWGQSSAMERRAK